MLADARMVSEEVDGMNMYNPQITRGPRRQIGARPSKAEAEAAARTLLRWAGGEPRASAPPT